MRTVSWKGGGGIAAILVALVVFIVPFTFIVFTAGKTQAEASFLEFSWPTEWAFFDNIVTVLQNRDYLLLRAFVNSSTILTVVAVSIMVVLGAMVGYVLQRRRSRWNPLVNGLVLAGLIIPPAVVPTIWVLQGSSCSRPSPGSSRRTSRSACRSASCCSARSSRRSRASSTRPPSSTAPGRSSCSSA